ncbi:hypothetical protein N9Z18_02595 [Verrucomicrobiales bacterium]|nr:hypothetical protein [Verrucomicrobiales bacterium]
MKSFVFALLVAIIGGGFLIAQRYEPEIRNYLGLPEIAEETPAEIDSKVENENKKKNNASIPVLSSEQETVAGDSTESAILRIVRLRYPDYKESTFEEFAPDLTLLPLDAYPDQITVNKPLNLKLTSNGILAGASFLTAGGSIRPLKLNEDGILTLASLAHSDLTTSAPLSETNFESEVRERFALAETEANERLQLMRDADASYFRKNSRILEKLNNENSLWGDPADNDFPPVQTALEKILHQSGFQVKAFFDMNRQSIEIDGKNFNSHAILVLLEGKDRGFGPYQWRSIAYLKGKEVVKWQDFPDDAVQTARRAGQR